jgi:hypothetical protein
MNQDDKDIFGQMMTGIAEIYGKKLSAPLLEIYWHLLTRYTLSQIKSALEKHMLNPDAGQFMPKPADIIRYLECDTQTQALQAWTKVINAIKSVGAYSSVAFDDPLIHVVIIEMGGWIALCHTSLEQLNFKCHEFSKRYSALQTQQPLTNSVNYPQKLSGIIEQSNYQTNSSDLKIEHVGDKTKH